MACLPTWLNPPELLPNVSITIDLELNSDKFVIMAADANADITFVIENCHLRIPMIKMADKQYLEIEQKLKEGDTLKSYMNAVIMNQFNISGKTRTEHWENMCAGYSPTKSAADMP